MKKILVTGATGFVGSRLAASLLKSGFEVALIVRENSSYEEIQNIFDKCKLYIFNGDIESLEFALKNNKPDVVIHCASLFLSSHTEHDVAKLIDSNIKFPSMLLEAMDKEGIKLFINTGTSWQHYNNDIYNPVNLYAATKQAFEDIIKFYVEAKALKTITLKLFDTYGIGDPRKKLLSLLDDYAQTQKELILSPGEQEINVVHVDDVANAYEKAIERLLTMNDGHEIYGVASKHTYTLKSLVKEYEKEKGIKLNVKWGGRPYRDREVMNCWNEFKTIENWNCRNKLILD